MMTDVFRPVHAVTGVIAVSLHTLVQLYGTNHPSWLEVHGQLVALLILPVPSITIMFQSAQVIVPSDPNSIVTGRGKCLNCQKVYLIQASVCASTYCSLDCQSNAMYMETVRGHVKSAMPTTDSVDAC
ncbi:hypothetical protein AaE_004409 [Aphanomyces astaci]|uniref:Uncharacterized protein n=1 Tax=Aphanomyces astaci TaxID=112090 RepID=A0A6A5AQ01_APHAT|nr:hypothetical protein AaE_004409 [Aphanomyces astaci]